MAKERKCKVILALFKKFYYLSNDSIKFNFLNFCSAFDCKKALKNPLGLTVCEK